MEEVAVVGWAQTKHERSKAGETDQDIIYKVVNDALLSCSMTIRDIDVVLDAGSDFLDGRGISNSMTLDAMGAHSKVESKVAGDGLLAAIYAYMRVASGMYSWALVVACGKSSESSICDQTRTFAEPFYLRPLGLDALAAGALQERAYLHHFRVDRDSVAAVAVKNRAAGAKNPNAQLRGEVTLEEVIASPDLVEPIRRLEACPATDGACAVVLADGPMSRSLGVRPAWKKGVGHSQDTCSPGSRELYRAGSARLAANIATTWLMSLTRWPTWTYSRSASSTPTRNSYSTRHSVCAPTAMARRCSVPARPVSAGGRLSTRPGGALCANPLVATGLVRLAEAAAQVSNCAGDVQVDGARKALAHAGSGFAMQSAVCVILER